MATDRNLVLTGFMGTGKTTVGQLLARRLSMTFVDTDELIESRHGSITRIFEEAGEAGFREIERRVAVEVGRRDGQVIATGGGMLLDPENLAELGRNSRVFCLTASVEEIHRRVFEEADRDDRPLLNAGDPRQRIIDLLAERDAGYQGFEEVSTDGLSVDAVAEEIARRWGVPPAR
ncbi:MAG TPA: shikimate kinase [Acidimicrobiia bacterium]|nr:shikimate kinase [Acidimicrobiia bacterium]